MSSKDVEDRVARESLKKELESNQALSALYKLISLDRAESQETLRREIVAEIKAEVGEVSSHVDFVESKLEIFAKRMSKLEPRPLQQLYNAGSRGNLEESQQQQLEHRQQSFNGSGGHGSIVDVSNMVGGGVGASGRRGSRGNIGSPASTSKEGLPKTQGPSSCCCFPWTIYIVPSRTAQESLSPKLINDSPRTPGINGGSRHGSFVNGGNSFNQSFVAFM